MFFSFLTPLRALLIEHETEKLRVLCQVEEESFEKEFVSTVIETLAEYVRDRNVPQNHHVETHVRRAGLLLAFKIRYSPGHSGVARS